MVTVAVNGAAVGSAVTDNNGNASVPYTPPLGSVGTLCVVAKFGGDTYYNSADSVGSCSPAGTTLNVALNSAALSYTGPLQTSPSKAVTLTAKLVDDLGRPLMGKHVTKSVLAQTVADASGV